MENMMARKKIKDLIEELRSWLPNYDSRGQNDYPVLLFRILASLPGGDELEDMGYETFQLGWHEADQLGRVLETIQDKSDVEDLVSGLVREEEEEEGMEEARRGRRPRSRSGARETATEEMRFTKNDDRVFKAFLNHRPAEGRKFSTDGRRLDGGAFLSNVASWETGPNGKETVVLHDLGSRTAQRIHRRLRKMGGPGIVKEDRASAREEAPRGEADRHAAEELVMYIENTSDLSLDGPAGQGRSVLLNALRKWRKGTYDSARAVKLFEYLTESGAKRYAKEFASERDWHNMFNVATRREAARQLEESFRSAVEAGEYDHVNTSRR